MENILNNLNTSGGHFLEQYPPWTAVMNNDSTEKNIILKIYMPFRCLYMKTTREQSEKKYLHEDKQAIGGKNQSIPCREIVLFRG